MFPLSSISDTQRGTGGIGGSKIRLGSMLARQKLSTTIRTSSRRGSSESGTVKLPPLSKSRRESLQENTVSKLKAHIKKYEFDEVSEDLFNKELNRSSMGVTTSKKRRTSRSRSRETLKEKRLLLRRMGKNRMRLSQDNSSRVALNRFKRIAVGVRVLVKLCLSLKSYLKQQSNADWSLLEMTLSLKCHFDRALSFRSLDMWRNAPSSRLEMVLRVPPGLRGSEHIRMVKGLLRGHRAFEDYPDHIQEQLAQSFIYQRYEARRVITRQGDPGREFYVIVSGSVLVNLREHPDEYPDQLSDDFEIPEGMNPAGNTRMSSVAEEETYTPTSPRISFVKTVNQLTAGETFGEFALMTNGRRHASIICKTDVEVLMLHKEDFDRIIKEPLESQRNKHLTFLKTLELFRYFPCEEFNEHVFYYQYYKNNTVVVRDAARSAHIIIIMSGVCRAVTEYSTGDASKKGKKTDSQLKLERIFPLHTEKIKREKVNFQNRDLKELENTAAIEFDITLKEQRLMDSVDVLPPLKRVNSGKGRLARRRRSSSLTGFFDMMEQKNKDPLNINLNQPFWSKRMSQSLDAGDDLQTNDEPETNDRFGNKTAIKEETEIRRKGVVRTWKRVTAIAGTKPEPVKPTRLRKFAQLAEFTEGSTFGLETLMRQRDPGPAISLISDGAECIFVSKKFMLEHANAKVFRVISDLVVTFPTTEFIGSYIQRQKKWQTFKHTLASQRT